MQVPLGPDRVSILGSAERNLKMIREALGIRIVARDGEVHLRGERRAVQAAREVLARLGRDATRARGLSRSEVLELIADESARQGLDSDEDVIADAFAEEAEIDEPGTAAPAGTGWDADEPRQRRLRGRLDVYAAGRQIRPLSPNQERYLEAIRQHDLVFGIGPAGTGKTYLAVAAAVHLLREGRVKKVILCRPAVEAGEKLGFLPGTLEAKVNPYLRPLFDALHDMMDFNTIRRFMDTDVVEVVPLAFMRGRTLNNSVIILDEAQNTTRAQMKMFLTRMGRGSKSIVTGDVTQMDIPDPRESGLIDAARRLGRVAGVGFVQLHKQDVVRHDLVQKIVEAYGEEQAAAGSALPAINEFGLEQEPDHPPRAPGR